jgi:hypothetical protein
VVQVAVVELTEQLPLLLVAEHQIKVLQVALQQCRVVLVRVAVVVLVPLATVALLLLVVLVVLVLQPQLLVHQ